jgi:xylan 1,4-beta-xylosidase
MSPDLMSMPLADIVVDTGTAQGPLELWRHTIGHGGINHQPLPDRVVDGLRELKPRLIRIFLQEFFNIYPAHGRFDWSRLDPYMEALARTGAKVVAAITIKPPVLFPTVDHAVWQPNDVDEWRRVIYELVKRYSIDRPIVTYWEVGNETDIGEPGGSPYLMPDIHAYGEYYRMTIAPILEAFPAAKVGGPAACWIDNEPLPGLVAYCRDSGTRLDFISWHRYSDDPRIHALGVAKAKALLAGFPGRRPEMLVTEWSNGFNVVSNTYDPSSGRIGRTVSVEELAFDPRRAAGVAASILAMAAEGLDWSFYYHAWDQVFYPGDWSGFFSAPGSAHMVQHWNEFPHRFGLFGVGGEVRPEYFVYQLLSRLGTEQIGATSDQQDLRVLAARDGRDVSLVLSNFTMGTTQDYLAGITFRGLTPGAKMLRVYRIDEQRRWTEDPRALQAIETRPLYAPATFRCQVYAPADSVVVATLADDGTGA